MGGQECIDIERKEEILIEPHKDTMHFFRNKIKQILSNKKLSIQESPNFMWSIFLLLFPIPKKRHGKKI